MEPTDTSQDFSRREVTGYLHPLYAQSLADFGRARELPHSRGWILERDIPNTQYRDAMGCYPLFTCQDWSQLCSDVEGLGDELVSLSLVTDPLGEYDVTELRRCFTQVCVPFKEHFVIDLSSPPTDFVAGHHRRNAKNALRQLRVELCPEPQQLVDEWVALYDVLIDRHGIEGVRAFSRSAFLSQLKVPGMVMFRAAHGETVVGMTLWYTTGKKGYYHLGAYSRQGYELKSSFALFWFAIEYFAARGLGWLNLGAGAGLVGGGEDGLTRFKRGWSNATRTAYFCGRILDPEKYAELINLQNTSREGYFPAYRGGEFA